MDHQACSQRRKEGRPHSLSSHCGLWVGGEKLPESLSQPPEGTWGPPCWASVFTRGTSSCTWAKGCVTFQTWSDHPITAVVAIFLLEVAPDAACRRCPSHKQGHRAVSHCPGPHGVLGPRARRQGAEEAEDAGWGWGFPPALLHFPESHRWGAGPGRWAEPSYPLNSSMGSQENTFSQGRTWSFLLPMNPRSAVTCFENRLITIYKSHS